MFFFENSMLRFIVLPPLPLCIPSPPSGRCTAARVKQMADRVKCTAGRAGAWRSGSGLRCFTCSPPGYFWFPSPILDSGTELDFEFLIQNGLLPQQGKVKDGTKDRGRIGTWETGTEQRTVCEYRAGEQRFTS